MLCQQCHQQEATIHLTVIPWPPTEPTRQDFCPVCYPGAEAARVKGYNTEPPKPPPADIENITAKGYLRAEALAKSNGVDIPAFKYIKEELKRRPAVRDRLALEMFELAWQALERRDAPVSHRLGLALTWTPTEPARAAEYIGWVEKIIRRCVELRRQLSAPPGERGPFASEISLGLAALLRVSPACFTALLEELKKRGADPALDPRWKVIATAEKSSSRPKRPNRRKK